MVTKRQIRQYAKRVADEFYPEKIILFGSCAYGKPTVDSDVDLLVIMEENGRMERPSLEVRRRLKPPFPLDLIVRSPQHIRKRLKMRDYFMRDIITNGTVLYERRDN